MMINKRLIRTVGESKKYIACNVVCQWVSLLANMGMTGVVCLFFAQLLRQEPIQTGWLIGAGAAAIAVRGLCAVVSSRMSYLSSKSVKKILREKIYRKLLRLGNAYREKAGTSEVVQVAVEGIDQLEVYFGSYLPQFFYAMLAPLTLFVCLSFVHWPTAVAEFLCVPLIPVSIALVQTWAKKLLAKYWGQYTALGDTFLENLQGLTTLKIFQADAYKNEEMDREAEKFRKITMKVLIMQLNSVTLMDLIAYGGAALGVILSVTQYQRGTITLAESLLIILLAAEFFIPLRQLGSFFHIAMNGMAASDKIFKLLDTEEPEEKTAPVSLDGPIALHDVHFSYEPGREILHGVTMTLEPQTLTAVVGESGSGKSTIAALLMGRNRGYTGSIRIGETESTDIPEAARMQQITYISHNSYLFAGTVRDNLRMGRPEATEDEMWEALRQMKLDAFLHSEAGLDTVLLEKASNLSGGQCQRLALARALLHDSPVYIFDEATSNIDVESETAMMEQIYRLVREKKKTVLLITHRLANAADADRIYVLEQGREAEHGTHRELLRQNGVYASLWKTQDELERFRKEGAVR